MTQKRFIIAAFLILLILNLVILGLMFRSHGPKGGMKPKPDMIIKDHLDFNSDQIKSYDELIKKHQVEIKKFESEIRKNKDLLFNALKSDMAINTDSIIDVVGENKRAIEIAHFAHFEDIKSLCEGDQIEKFDSFVDDLKMIFSPPHPPGHKR